MPQFPFPLKAFLQNALKNRVYAGILGKTPSNVGLLKAKQRNALNCSYLGAFFILEFLLNCKLVIGRSGARRSTKSVVPWYGSRRGCKRTLGPRCGDHGDQRLLRWVVTSRWGAPKSTHAGQSSPCWVFPAVINLKRFVLCVWFMRLICLSSSNTPTVHGN